MRRRKAIFAGVAGLVGVGMTVWLAAAYAPAEAPAKDIGEMIPADGAAVLVWRGWDTNRAAFEASAAGDLYKVQGVKEFCHSLTDLILSMIDKSRAKVPLQDPLPPEQQLTGPLLKIALAGPAYVATIPVSNPKPGLRPAVVLSLGQRKEAFQTLLKRLEAPGAADDTIGGYKCRVWTDTGGITQCYGFVGQVFIFSPDKEAYRRVADCVAGKAPHLAATARYQAVMKGLDRKDALLEGYVAAEPILKTFADSIDPKGKRALKALGIDAAQAVGMSVGFEGKAFRSTVFVHAPSPRIGVMRVFDGKPLTAADAAMVPPDSVTFTVARFDTAKAVKGLHRIVTRIDPEAGDRLYGFLDQSTRMLGFDVLEELEAAFGDRVAISVGPTPGPILFPMPVLILEVKDRKRAERIIQSLAKTAVGMMGPAEPGTASPVTTGTYHGMTLVGTRPIKGGSPVLAVIQPTAAIGDKYMVLGPTALSVKEAAYALAMAPADYRGPAGFLANAAQLQPGSTVFSYTDTARATDALYRAIPTLAMISNLVSQFAGVQIRLDRLPPPAELKPHLFPAVGSVRPAKDGIRFDHRGPLGPVFSMTDPIVPAIAIAALLPAVQQAREAARRTQCRNSGHQLAIALANYEETHGQFPTATVPNKDLPREKRLSWMVAILPFVEEAPLYRRTDMKKAWDDPANAHLKPALEQFQCPTQGQTTGANGFGLTHWAGCGGVGPLALDMLGGRHGGIFSDKRGMTLGGVHDGTSQTILVGEVNQALGPWAAGGMPTVRTLDPKIRPINSGKPANFGSSHEGGAFFTFTDSQVRFISENIDPKVFRALCTASGGEVINDEDY